MGGTLDLAGGSELLNGCKREGQHGETYSFEVYPWCSRGIDPG